MSAGLLALFLFISTGSGVRRQKLVKYSRQNMVAISRRQQNFSKTVSVLTFMRVLLWHTGHKIHSDTFSFCSSIFSGSYFPFTLTYFLIITISSLRAGTSSLLYNDSAHFNCIKITITRQLLYPLSHNNLLRLYLPYQILRFLPYATLLLSCCTQK